MENILNLPLVNKTFHGDVVTLRFRKPVGYSFIPGQCVEIHHPDGDYRTYSIASGVQKDSLVFFIKKLPQGKLSTWVYDELKENDIVRISKEAYGFFTLGDTDKPFTFIATGTGIAPFNSFIETYMSDESIPLKQVIYGARYLKEIIPVPFKNTVYCLSQDTSESPSVYKGRVTDYLLEHKDKIDVDSVYYVCGLDSALRDVADILTAAGVPTENIIYEVFYYQMH